MSPGLMSLALDQRLVFILPTRYTAVLPDTYHSSTVVAFQKTNCDSAAESLSPVLISRALGHQRLVRFCYFFPYYLVPGIYIYTSKYHEIVNYASPKRCSDIIRSSFSVVGGVLVAGNSSVWNEGLEVLRIYEVR
ncbi:unnamed protein product, partial [Laminaria digitata]